MSIAAPWRDPKTGIWKLRKRVPARYAAVAGKTIVKISTGTADRKAAMRGWPAVFRKWAAMKAGWELALFRGVESVKGIPRTLSYRETLAIALVH